MLLRDGKRVQEVGKAKLALDRPGELLGAPGKHRRASQVPEHSRLQIRPTPPFLPNHLEEFQSSAVRSCVGCEGEAP